MKGWLPALLLAVAFILAACGGAGGGQQGSGSGGMAGVGHSKMDHGSMGMGSIEMAKVALKHAEHEEIIQLSRNIISSQQAEIEELKSIKQEEFGTSNVPMEMSPEQMRSMGMMMDPQQLANKEPFDKAFIDTMIPHHQSAIEMAQVAYEKSDNPKIKELAENIISAQQREIEQMREWRREWYPQG